MLGSKVFDPNISFSIFVYLLCLFIFIFYTYYIYLLYFILIYLLYLTREFIFCIFPAIYIIRSKTLPIISDVDIIIALHQTFVNFISLFFVK